MDTLPPTEPLHAKAMHILIPHYYSSFLISPLPFLPVQPRAMIHPSRPPSYLLPSRSTSLLRPAGGSLFCCCSIVLRSDQATRVVLVRVALMGGWEWVDCCDAVARRGGGGSSSFLSSGSSSSLTDDDEEGGATSFSPRDRGVIASSSSSLTASSEEPGTAAMQMDAQAARGPLFELSTMLDHLPALRTGLSKHYHGRSQSFTSLADVTCVEDLAKKATPCTRRTKAPRGHTAALLGVKSRLSKTIAKKQAPRGTTTTGLSRGDGNPPSYQGKTEMHRC